MPQLENEADEVRMLRKELSIYKIYLETLKNKKEYESKMNIHNEELNQRWLSNKAIIGELVKDNVQKVVELVSHVSNEEIENLKNKNKQLKNLIDDIIKECCSKQESL